MQLIQPNKKIFALIYGQSGSGKTHLAATYCLMNPDDPVILIDADQGSETLEAKEFKNCDNLFVVSFDAFQDLDQIYSLCEKNTVEGWCKAIPELEGKLKKPFKCIIWDTWTEVQWILSAELRKKNGLLGKGLNYRNNLQLQHWGQLTDLNKLAISSFKELPMECLFLAQAGTKEDANTGAIIKGPAIHGKLVQEMPAYFTTVIYTYNTVKGGWGATTLSKQGWPAKVRGRAGKDIENPTLKELLW